MKISLYPPQSIHELGQRDNQEDAITQWNNRFSYSATEWEAMKKAR